MTFIFIIVGICLVSYLVGGVPFGLWIGLLWKRVDIRTLGSKNIGATNVLRVLGPGPAAVVFALDTAKGAAGILLAHLAWTQLPGWHPPQAALAFPYLVVIGLCAVAGHSCSPFLRFKGGKGVATSLGVLLALSPLVAAVGLAVWLIVVAISRFVSLASLAAAVSLPVASLLVLRGEQRVWMTGMGAALALLVIVKHRGNIQRLLAGTESRLGQRVAAAPAETLPPDASGGAETISETVEAH